MEVASSYFHQNFESNKRPAKRVRAKSVDEEQECNPKKRLMSADEFCFSFEDLNRQLYSKHSNNNESADANEKDSDEPDFCFWCDAKRFQGDFKCPYHENGTKLSPTKTVSQDEPTKLPYAYQGIPEILKLFKRNTADGKMIGIQAAKSLPVGAWIGPYEGKLVKIEEGVPVKKNKYMWEIFKDGKLYGYIDGSDENTASWMRFIRCARHKDEQNLFAFQYMNKIYYRTYKTIEPGQELLVWYDQMYTQYLKGSGNDYKNMMNMSFPEEGDSLVPDGYTPAVFKSTSENNEKTTSLDSKAAKTSPSTPPLSTMPMSSNLQMQTSYERIGALMASPTKSAGQTTSGDVSTSQGQTKISSNSPIQKPIAISSRGFSLTITNSHVTSPTKQTPVNNRSASPTAAVVPSPNSPMSPLTPSSHDSGFSFEATSDENSKGESNETAVWRCGQCRKTFPQRAMLQVHVCCQVPFRPYRCGHCNESFPTSGEMRTHAVIHQRRKPFKCGYCSRSFSGATTLNNHIRIHTGEKPFKCEKCGKTFSQGSQLSKHERIPGDCLPT